jgi:hypothetical protein
MPTASAAAQMSRVATRAMALSFAFTASVPAAGCSSSSPGSCQSTNGDTPTYSCMMSIDGGGCPAVAGTSGAYPLGCSMTLPACSTLNSLPTALPCACALTAVDGATAPEWNCALP